MELSGDWRGTYEYTSAFERIISMVISFRIHQPFLMTLQMRDTQVRGWVRDQKIWGGLLPTAATLEGWWDPSTATLRFTKCYEPAHTAPVEYEGMLEGDVLHGTWTIQGRRSTVCGRWKARRSPVTVEETPMGQLTRQI